MLFCSKSRKSYLLIFVLIFGYLHTFLQLFLVNGQRLALATTAPRSSPMHPEDCLKGKSLGILLKMTRVLRQSVVIDSRVLSLTLKRLRRLLTIRLRSEEDECRFYTINAWHCQAFISQVNWNLPKIRICYDTISPLSRTECAGHSRQTLNTSFRSG